MKALITCMAVAIVVTSPGAYAEGCLAGGAAGGVAGHYAGHHAVLGAAGGCVAGHEIAKHRGERKREEQAREDQYRDDHAEHVQRHDTRLMARSVRSPCDARRIVGRSHSTRQKGAVVCPRAFSPLSGLDRRDYSTKQRAGSGWAKNSPGLTT